MSPAFAFRSNRSAATPQKLSRGAASKRIRLGLFLDRGVSTRSDHLSRRRWLGVSALGCGCMTASRSGFAAGDAPSPLMKQLESETEPELFS